MNYKNHTDAELRLALATYPNDLEVLIEAADRFLAMPTDDALEAAHDEGYKEGYAEGYAEGRREDDSR